MSYIDDYNDNVNRKKIPYDDIPISRNVSSHSSSRRNGQKFSFSGYKILISLVAVLFVANIVLCCTAFYFLRHGKVKHVNVYNNEITATEESVSLHASNTAYRSSICVAAGGSCSNVETFLSNTLSRGSGVIYRVDKKTNTIYFITCYHVIDGYNKDAIYVLLPSQLVPITVELVSYSSHYDIAVLKYKATNADNVLDGCVPIQAYDSTYLSLGDKVFAIGNPLSSGFSITEGIISRLNTMINVESNAFESREIQITAAINSGNSGGGLFNAEGKFIGIVNAKLNSVDSGRTQVAGIAYAIPGTLVLGIAESIIQNGGKATYVNLGATLGYDEDLGITFENVEYNGSLKPILKYYVVVESVDGAIAYRNLHSGDMIESIEFKILVDGTETTKKVNMYNKFVFEDYSFSIVKGSEIKFYLSNNKIVTVTASAIKTID